MSPGTGNNKKNTISRQKVDWYISCSYEFYGRTTSKKTDVVGVCLGVKTLATLSDGEVLESVKYDRRFETKLSRMQGLTIKK
ncbi:hypothetical protein [Trichodesmium erythraeum]|uniref:hypothetical protein n=1 Tax=Trichodesmium erythraeum TaxID=1206 RepID=UPI00003C9DEC|nr:hypothetical protein [Trichodesmium erythraeum GBRTRLIN201]